MTPTPPEGFKIIPREWLEAGNPLPEDAIVWNGVLKCWIEAELAGCPTGVIRPYATAQPLPCFQKGGDETCAQKIHSPEKSQTSTLSQSASNAPVAVPSPDQGPERVAPEPEQARNNALNKLAYEQSGEPRTECPTCAGMNDLVATQGQRIAELEREKKALVKQLDFVAKNEGGGALLVSDIYADMDDMIKANTQLRQERDSARGARAACLTVIEERNTELTQLRATIETLTRERDEARAEAKGWKSDCESICQAQDNALKELAIMTRLKDHAEKAWADQRIALLAQLAASEKDRQWQPIETAPKDGTVVFICNEAAYPCSVEAAASHLGKWWHGESVEYDYEPTHWMPLPKAPDAAMKEAK